MKYVLDSGVAFKIVVPEINSDKAIRLRDDFRAGIHIENVLPALNKAEKE